MNELNLTTPSLLFSAISLILLAYTNRFLSYASVIRTLNERYQENPSKDPTTLKQIRNFLLRLRLIRAMQTFGAISLIFCLASMFFFSIKQVLLGEIVFGAGMTSLAVSLLLCVWEIQISTEAIHLHLQNIKQRTDKKQSRKSKASPRPWGGNGKGVIDEGANPFRRDLEEASESIPSDGKQAKSKDNNKHKKQQNKAKTQARNTAPQEGKEVEQAPKGSEPIRQEALPAGREPSVEGDAKAQPRATKQPEERGHKPKASLPVEARGNAESKVAQTTTEAKATTIEIAQEGAKGGSRHLPAVVLQDGERAEPKGKGGQPRTEKPRADKPRTQRIEADEQREPLRPENTPVKTEESDKPRPNHRPRRLDAVTVEGERPQERTAPVRSVVEGEAKPSQEPPREPQTDMSAPVVREPQREVRKPFNDLRPKAERPSKDEYPKAMKPTAQEPAVSQSATAEVAQSKPTAETIRPQEEAVKGGGAVPPTKERKVFAHRKAKAEQAQETAPKEERVSRYKQRQMQRHGDK